MDDYGVRGGVESAALIRQLQRGAEARDRQDHTHAVRIAMDIWDGRYDSHVEALLSEMFHPANYQRLRLFLHLSTNLVRLVADKVAHLHAGGAPISLAGATTADESSLAAYLAQREDPDETFSAVQGLLLAAHNVTLKPTVREREGSTIIVDDIYTPDELRVISHPHDPLRHVLIAYHYRVDEDEYWDAWTDEHYTVLDGDLRVREVRPNPYGVIPFVTFRASKPTSSYWCLQPFALANATLEVAVLETLINSRMRACSFKQPVFSGDISQLASEQVLDPTTPLCVGEGGSVTMLDLQSNIGQMQALVESRIERVAASYGLSASQLRAQATAQSGFARLVEMEGTRDVNRRMARQMIPAEQRYHKLAMLVASVDGLAGVRPLSPGVNVAVNPRDGARFEQAADQIAIDQRDLDLGLLTPVDILRRQDPDLSAEDALARVRENKALNAQLVSPTARPPSALSLDALTRRAPRA